MIPLLGMLLALALYMKVYLYIIVMFVLSLFNHCGKKDGLAIKSLVNQNYVWFIF